ncbi:MAG: glycoside hydrolase family 15 protein [Myxococcota bacterium]|nr:glycoside hydrolase family 15 protein [Myxococcota bacterium]
MSYAQQIDRSWYHLTTGNGHGFQIFDLNEGKLTDFLEHPYAYVAPPDERREGGIGRRDLAYDAYFGLTVNEQHTWFTRLDNVGYEAESHVIVGTKTLPGIQAEVRYFAPFGLDANAMIMLIKVRNTGSSDVTISPFAKANMKLGSGRPQPAANGEVITWDSELGYGTETGPGGGTVLYFPLGQESTAGCGSDSQLYRQIGAGDVVAPAVRCSGEDQVLVTSTQTTLPAGESFWWGQAVLFINNNPNEPQADDFRDYRTPEDVIEQWQAFAGDKGASDIYQEAMAEFEEWRVAPEAVGATGLTDAEKAIWRQSEAVLRMGQVMEPIQANRRNRGMFLAALPIGKWHIGWVRDGAYAIVSQAMNGHTEEARLGVDFLLSAWAGFFSSAEYLGRDYRISSVRYYGNGKEEGDFNFFGPNVETDGFGLTLWGARAYMHYSCDKDWLETTTLHGDTVFEALTQVAADIDATTENNLPIPECSIWEVHWGHKKVFTYTAATMIRGLYDYAAIARLAERDDLADYYQGRADDILEATRSFLVNTRTQSLASYQGAASSDIFVDGSTVEMLHWGLIPEDDPIYRATLQYYERLRTRTGGYRRLEEQLSLNGEAQAGTYDLSEWILLDLRIGEIFRRSGDQTRSDDLLNRVTVAATVNNNLIPELYEPDQLGIYAGEVPMVGYGAGAWQMALLEKRGRGAPAIDAGWAHCDSAQPTPTEPTDDAGMNASTDGGIAAPAPGDNTTPDTMTNGPGLPNSPAGPNAESDPFADDTAATFCASASGNGSLPSWLILLAILLPLGVRRHG